MISAVFGSSSAKGRKTRPLDWEWTGGTAIMPVPDLWVTQEPMCTEYSPNAPFIWAWAVLKVVLSMGSKLAGKN